MQHFLGCRRKPFNSRAHGLSSIQVTCTHGTGYEPWMHSHCCFDDIWPPKEASEEPWPAHHLIDSATINSQVWARRMARPQLHSLLHSNSPDLHRNLCLHTCWVQWLGTGPSLLYQACKTNSIHHFHTKACHCERYRRCCHAARSMVAWWVQA